jgi:hypothetical protein
MVEAIDGDDEAGGVEPRGGDEQQGTDDERTEPVAVRVS